MNTPDLVVWTIFKNPIDFPGKFVARKSRIGVGVVEPTEEHHVADSLEAAREMLPPFLFNLGREPLDERHIVESWI